MPTVFLACPTYNGQLDAGTARSIYATASQRDDVQILPMVNGKSLLASNCNWLWCNCLNARLDGHDITWFAMLHADIEPERWWLDKLLAEAEKYEADMMSAIIPIKDQRGVTSTAIGGQRGDGRHFGYGRLTQRQVWHEDFPETFDLAMAIDALERLPGDLAASPPHTALWLNTGCMIVRCDKPWAGTEVYFEMEDGVELHNGRWRLFDFSEDWAFSQKVHDAGGKLMATRVVSAIHKGVGLFPNDKPWGNTPNDFAACKEAVCA